MWACYANNLMFQEEEEERKEEEKRNRLRGTVCGCGRLHLISILLILLSA